MDPLRFGPNRAMDRTWKHQGVPPVDCQHLTLSTGVSGAVIPREGKEATLKVIDQPGAAGRLGWGSDPERKQTWLSAVSTK